jgi:hypothetical protein
VVVVAAGVVTERGVGLLMDESMAVNLGLSWIASFGWFTLEGAGGLVLHRQKHIWSWRLMFGGAFSVEETVGLIGVRVG